MNANKELALLFSKHNYAFEKEDDRLFIDLENKIAVESYVCQQAHEKGCISQLDVRVELPNGQVLLESVGDIGATSEEAKQMNLVNFAKNSFHVITACFNDDKTDPHITFEEWEVGGTIWDVYIGGFGLKFSPTEPVKVPDDLYDFLCQLILDQLKNEKDYYWARTFVCNANHQINCTELLINNETCEEGELRLLDFPWELRNEFYSIRNFMILKKKQPVPYPLKNQRASGSQYLEVRRKSLVNIK